MVFVFHQLAYFTEHNALQFHPCCCKGHELLLSLCCVVFHCINVPRFFDPLIYSWALRLLPVIGYCKLCCYEHWVHRFFWIIVSGFLGYNPSSGLAGSKGSSIFSFLRKFHTVFHSGCTSLHSHQQCTKDSLFSTTSPAIVVFSFMMASQTGVKWYLITCIFLMASDAEHLFMCLWDLCMSSGPVSVQVFCPFFYLGCFQIIPLLV